MQEKVADYVLGILSQKEIDALEEHISGCTACSQYAHELKNENRLILKLGEKLDAGMAIRQDKVIEALNRYSPTARTKGLSIWRIIMKNPITKLAAAAVIIVAAFFVISQISSPTSAFAKVIEKVTNAESISFTLKQQLGNPPAFIGKMYIQGEKIRMDMTGAEGDQPGLDKLREEMKRRNLTAFQSMIGDFKAKEAIDLDHFRKTFKKRQLDDRAVDHFTQTNLVEQFRSVKPEDAQRTGEESQNGRKVDVYVVRHVDLIGIKAELSGEEGQRMTVWVDRASSLPVKILLETSFHVEGKSRDWIEFSEFTWNEPFDENLFSLQAPEGYTPAQL
jgi:outer membrane lipoprotein-sorting protein